MDEEKLHVPPTKEWKFNRDRHNKDHETNCTDGYIEPKKENVLNIHHVLCISLCKDSAMPASFTADDKAFVKICMANTVWDINSGNNNIGLPKKWAYIKHPKDTSTPKWGELPCHQVDHNLYISALQRWMAIHIWKKIKGASKEKKCEHLKGDNIAELFNEGSSHWKEFLTDRGKTNGGTKASLEYCLKGTPQIGVNDENWHIPFSMAPDEETLPKRIKPVYKENKIDRDALLRMIK